LFIIQTSASLLFREALTGQKKAEILSLSLVFPEKIALLGLKSIQIIGKIFAHNSIF